MKMQLAGFCANKGKSTTLNLGSPRFWFYYAAIVCAFLLSPNQIQAQSPRELLVEIVASRDATGNICLPHGEPFDVRFTNLSGQPINIWDDLCKPGYQAFSFRVQEANGENHTVVKREAPASAWTEHPPKFITIAPGKSYSRKINLSDFFWGQRAWLNPPEPNTGEMLEVKALFEIKDTDEARRQGIWTGAVESAAQRLTVINTKLTTPQEYLWNACPRQALNMLKADASLINKRAEDQCAPLHHAVRFGYKEIVIWLIEHGADVNAQAYNGFTPLHFAERKDMAQILIKAGANLEHRDNWGKTLLQAAAENRRTEVTEAILESGYKIDLCTALKLKQRDVVLKLLLHDSAVVVGGEGGADLHQNVTPLGLAAAEGDLELMSLLLEAGAPINDPTHCVRYGGTATPLCNAVWHDKPEAVEFLLKHGAAIDVVGGRFVRSLTEYVENHSSQRIKELFAKYGANPSLGHQIKTPEKVANKLPVRIASGIFKLPHQTGAKTEGDKR